jgi:hypothetical protein
MQIFKSGDLVEISAGYQTKQKIEYYKVNNLELINEVIDKSDRIVSISKYSYGELSDIPKLKVEFKLNEFSFFERNHGIFLGMINIEEYGQIFKYYVILFKDEIAIFKKLTNNFKLMIKF